MLVAGKQVVKEQIIDTLRESVNSDPRIKIGGAAFDDHHQRARLGLPGA
jgi:hypothetical protein